MTNEAAQPVTKGDLAGFEERLGDQMKAKISIGDLNAFGERLETRIVGRIEKSIGDRIDSAVDTLARITKEGFDAVDKRFDGVERRFVEVEGRLDHIDFRLDEVAYKIDVTDLTRRVGRIEQKVGISGT